MGVAENLRRVSDRVGEAAARAGRRPESVRIVGVTKRVNLERIREAVDCGLTDIGENRVQEAEIKIPRLDRAGAACHLIGHLQSNKAGKAVGLFSCIQSVDSVALAERLDRLAGGPVRVLVQMKLGDEAAKAGVSEGGLADLVRAVRASAHLRLEGLMGIPPFFDDVERVRPYFRRLRERADAFSLDTVSMGMSRDFEVAIEEGATMVRIGTLLFGERRGR